MPSLETARSARQLNDVPREAHTISALRCLDQTLDTNATAAPRQPPPTYRNVGVQTLPPLNGNVFKQIHGREPAQRDYVRNMGSAAIGRFAADPRLNHYDLIHGASYPVHTTANKETYTDSAFQIASHGTRRKALARAKVKASMTATKYRDPAFQAGYIVSAESRDEFIAHSEQFSTLVQLDAEGNLLEGTIETRGLPNILGAPVLNRSLVPEVARKAADFNHERRPTHAHQRNQEEFVEQVPLLSSARLLNSKAQPVMREPRNPDAGVPPRDTCMKEHGPDSVFDSEPISARSELNRSTICGSGAEHVRTTQSFDRTTPSLENPNLGRPPKNLLTGLKGVTSTVRRNVVNSFPAPRITFLSQRDRDHNTLRKKSLSDSGVSQSPVQLAISLSGEVNQESALIAVQSGTQSKVGSNSIASKLTNTPLPRNLKSHRSNFRPFGDTYVGARAGGNRLSRARDDGPSRRSSIDPNLSRTPQYTSNPPLATAGFQAQRIETSRGLSSLPRKRNFDQAGIDPVECQPGTKWLNRTPSSNQREKYSFKRRISPEKTRDNILQLSTATQTHSEKPGEIASGGINGKGSTGVQKNPISRALRKPRQPTEPYVPPAMRARVHKDYKAERKR